ncbi:guanylate cyclase [Sedimentitalea sp. CY04]|uniref:Guanylate cyclase n=1 Tax=Parasedimentitalea denitrificans TaxID=2211118 RepID=A0ABX0W3A1_9RHOB|nr:adenylate/guanylate cyclase domain-containing protein [Sedimentitalea sp. CY04]NIZ59428.1 guanylate cyclase [Sedimentitalea sp. CY04]
MIRTSPELLAVSRRWHQAILTGNTEILRDFMSAAEELRFIGTADNEYWNGSVVGDGVAGFFAEIPALISVEEEEAEAFENGETGWSSFVHRIHFEGLPEASIQRTTLVFVLEGAGWKIMQRHGSAPVPNIVHMGREQTEIQRLADTARDEGPALNQTEGLASVLFTDLEGSTKLAATLGDQRWSTLINDHFRVVEDIVKAHHGQFVKSLGDGTLSSFSSTHEALDAAIKMQRRVFEAKEEPRLGLRIGIHTGDVVQTRGDFFGTVVNMAARITTHAKAGEILISNVTREMVGGVAGLRLATPITVSFKGLEGQHLVHPLEWRA